MLIKFVKHKIKLLINQIVERKLDEEFEKRLFIADQMRQFESACDDMLASKVEAVTHIDDLIDRFKNIGISVVEKEIDIDDFEKWGGIFPQIMNFYENMGDVKIEKPLEHFLTMKYLDIKKEDVIIDIAAAGSPWVNILHKRLGNKKTFRQDLVYKDGVNKNEIGGNAGNMPVSDDFADVLTLHCAFECFQGDSDIEFAKEAGRVLNKNGRLGIVPLYVDSIYFVKSGPKADRRFINVEKEAKWIWRDDDYLSEPFSRHYSPESFKKRVFDNLKGLTGEIIHFTNLSELEGHFEGQRIYCHFMLRAVKND